MQLRVLKAGMIVVLNVGLVIPAPLFEPGRLASTYVNCGQDLRQEDFARHLNLASETMRASNGF